MNAKRGLLAALLGAISGMVLTVLLMQVFAYFEGRYSLWEYTPPLVGTSSILAATAWATYAPKVKQSFAWTLMLIAPASLFLDCFLYWLTIDPFLPRQNPKEPSLLGTISAMTLLALSPILPAAWLSRRRVRRPWSIL